MLKYEVMEIEEPDFGCEGRPDGAVPMARVTLRSVQDNTVIKVEIADGYLYQEEIDEGNIIYQNDVGRWKIENENSSNIR